MPTWAPVKLMAGSPSSCMAIAISAMEICSPVDRSMSISRAGGCFADLAGQVDQLVGGVAAGADDDDDLVAGLPGADGPAGGRHDALGRGHAGAAEFLHDQGHGRLLIRKRSIGCNIRHDTGNCQRSPLATMPEPSRAAERRKIVAHGASRGYACPMVRSPGGAKVNFRPSGGCQTSAASLPTARAVG